MFCKKKNCRERKENKENQELNISSVNKAIVSCLFFELIIYFKRFYLFLERGEGKEKERERNTLIGCFSQAPNWGPGLQPRQVP